MGSVTFFEADWCIPNALGPPWQEYPYRDELTRVIAHDHDRGSLDPNAGPRHEVLARVDLGHRPPFGWKEEAAAQVRSVVGLVATRTGAPSWRRAGFSCLMVDGDVGTYSFGPGDEPLFTKPDHYGMNGFADALADYKTELAGLLSNGPLPTDVAEALRLVGEAGQVDSRENTLNGTATIAEQTVIVLQVAAVERLAAYAGMDRDAFASELAAEWALARYHQKLAWAVERCLSGVGGGADPLFHRVVSFPSGRRRLSFCRGIQCPRPADCGLPWPVRARPRGDLAREHRGRKRGVPAARLVWIGSWCAQGPVEPLPQRPHARQPRCPGKRSIRPGLLAVHRACRIG